MSSVSYVVEPHEGAWRVVLNDTPYGPHSSQELAVAAAIKAAHTNGGKFVTGTRVMLKEEGVRKPRLLWSYGDPLPKGIL